MEPMKTLTRTRTRSARAALDIECMYRKMISTFKKYKLDKVCRIPLLYSQSKKGKNDPGEKHYTLSGLSMIFFFLHKGKIVHKRDLLAFLSQHWIGHDQYVAAYPRHFGLQYGFHLLIQHSYHPQARRTLKAGEYCLYSVTTPHPAFTAHRACTLSAKSFQSLKSHFSHRCAVCGSAEGQPNLKDPSRRTCLERGHMNPTKPMTLENTLPMCFFCNQVYKNKFVFDHRGVIREVLTRVPEKTKKKQSVNVRVPRMRRAKA